MATSVIFFIVRSVVGFVIRLVVRLVVRSVVRLVVIVRARQVLRPFGAEGSRWSFRAMSVK